MGIHYHPGYANVVADALSRKGYCNMAMLRGSQPELCKEFERLNLGFVANMDATTIEMKSTLEQDIRKGQWDDEKNKRDQRTRENK